MRKIPIKYSPPLVIFGAMLFALSFAAENILYQGFITRLDHYYIPFTEPFPKGPLTILLYSLALLGLIMVIVTLIFTERKNEH